METRAGRGRPPILSQQNPEHLKKVAAQIKEHPNSVKTVIAKLEAQLALEMSPDTLKRLSRKEWLPSRSRSNVAQESAGGC